MLVSGCATFQGHKQRVKVVSDPPGAQIRTEDGPIGVTPQFVDIRRSRKKKVWIQWKGDELPPQNLKPTYRWRESFFANLVFLSYAPVGWVLDYVTGTAWEYEPKLTFKGPPGAKPFQDSQGEIRIAIAPPKAEQSLLSDELGSWMERTIQARYPDARVVPFFQSLTTFNEFDDDHSDTVDSVNRDDLYAELGVHRIVESKVIPRDNGREVSLLTTTTDVFTDQKLDEFKVYIDGSGIDFNKRDPWLRRLGNLASIVPNTITFDTTTPRAQILVDGNVDSVDTARYFSQSQKSDTLWHYISSLGLRSFKSPSHSTRLAFTFRFVPSLAIYYDRFLFRSKQPLPNEFGEIRYDWYTLYGGVGPEVGIESSIGHQYLQLIPGFGLNWIHWSQGPNQFNDVKMRFAIETEIGWSFFVTKRLNVRLFGRILSMTGDQWQSAIGNTLGRNVEIRNPQLALSGIALGFYFPEVKTSLKEWFQ